MTNIVIKRIFNKQYQSLTNKCINENKNDKYIPKLNNNFINLYKFIKNQNQIYRQRDCILLCFQKILYNNCKCFDNRFPILFKGNKCLKKDIFCLFNIWKLFIKNNIKKLCDNYCPIECNSNSFQISTSRLKFPNNIYINQLIKSKWYNKLINKTKYKFTKKELKNNIISFNIYYDELKYTVVDEYQKTSIIKLIGGIGGIFIFLKFNLLFGLKYTVNSRKMAKK